MGGNRKGAVTFRAKMHCWKISGGGKTKWRPAKKSIIFLYTDVERKSVGEKKNFVSLTVRPVVTFERKFHKSPCISVTVQDGEKSKTSTAADRRAAEKRSSGKIRYDAPLRRGTRGKVEKNKWITMINQWVSQSVTPSELRVIKTRHWRAGGSAPRPPFVSI